MLRSRSLHNRRWKYTVRCVEAFHRRIYVNQHIVLALISIQTRNRRLDRFGYRVHYSCDTGGLSDLLFSSAAGYKECVDWWWTVKESRCLVPEVCPKRNFRLLIGFPFRMAGTLSTTRGLLWTWLFSKVKDKQVFENIQISLDKATDQAKSGYMRITALSGLKKKKQKPLLW